MRGWIVGAVVVGVVAVGAGLYWALRAPASSSAGSGSLAPAAAKDPSAVVPPVDGSREFDLVRQTGEYFYQSLLSLG